MMRKRVLGLAIICITIILLRGTVLAKPMDPATLEEAVGAEYVVLAELVRMSSESDVEYFLGTMATYKVIEVLKGNEIKEHIRVRYLFQDGSACIGPTDWSIAEESLPQKGSRWLLFLNKDISSNNQYDTYRGDYGRWKDTEESRQQVETMLMTKTGEVLSDAPVSSTAIEIGHIWLQDYKETIVKVGVILIILVVTILIKALRRFV